VLCKRSEKLEEHLLSFDAGHTLGAFPGGDCWQIARGDKFENSKLNKKNAEGAGKGRSQTSRSSSASETSRNKQRSLLKLKLNSRLSRVQPNACMNPVPFLPTCSTQHSPFLRRRPQEHYF
jgi:hypothetical protein